MTNDYWLQQFLSSRGLSDIDLSKPFYQYKVTEDEYESLKRSLTAYKFGNRPTREFWARFVLFSALAMSRSPSASRWNWQDVYDELNWESPPFSPNLRSDGIETGARFWGRPIAPDQTGKRYIGVAMIMGGVSLSRLVSQGNVFGRVFHSLIRYLQSNAGLIWSSGKTGNLDHLAGQACCVLRQDKEGPGSLDPKLTSEVLAEAALAVHTLLQKLTKGRQSAQSWTKEDIEPHFNDFVQSFPSNFLTVEKIKNFLNEWMTAQRSLAEAEESQRLCKVARYLALIGKDEYKFITSVRLRPDLKDINPVSALFSITPDTDFPSSAKARLYMNLQCVAMLIRGNEDALKIKLAANRPIVFKDLAALKSVEIRLEIQNRGIHSATLPEAPLLSLDEPLVFGESDTPGILTYIGSGSVSTNRRRIFFTLPAKAKIASVEKNEEGNAPKPVGRVMGLELYTSERTVRIEVEDVVYVLKPDSMDELEQFSLSGKLLSSCPETIDGWPVFLGEPQVLSITDHGFIPASHVAWTNGQGKQVQRPSRVASDVYLITVRSKSDGPVRRRFRAVVIPEAASIQSSAGKSGDNAMVIELFGWGPIELKAIELQSNGAGENLSQEIKTEETLNGARIYCPPEKDLLARCLNNSAFPNILTSIQASIDSRPFVLSLPVPVESASFYFRGQRLGSRHGDHVVSVTDIRDLQVCAAYRDAKTFGQPVLEIASVRIQKRPIKEIEADGGQESCTEVRDANPLVIPIYVSSTSGRGILTYHEFKDALQLMLNRSTYIDSSTGDIVKQAQLTLKCGRQKPQILKVRFPGTMLIERRLDEKEYLEVDSPRDSYLKMQIVDQRDAYLKIRIVDLFPRLLATPRGFDSLYSPDLAASWSIANEENRVPMPDACQKSHSPWFAMIDNDLHCRVKPTVVGQDYEANAKLLETFPFLKLRELWTKRFMSAEERRTFETLLIEEMHKPQSPQWDAIVHQCYVLGTRAFSELPYFQALRGHVPLAFAFGLIIDILMTQFHRLRRPDEPSVIYAAARRQGWRWDLLSRAAIQESLHLVSGFFRKFGTNADLPALLALDAFHSQALKHKFECAALHLGMFRNDEYAEPVADLCSPTSPYKRSIQTPRTADALSILEDIEFMRSIKEGPANEILRMDDKELSRFYGIAEDLEKILSTEKPRAHDFFERFKSRLIGGLIGTRTSGYDNRWERLKRAFEAPLLAGFLWCLAYGRTWSAMDVDFMSKCLAKADIRCKIELALSGDPRWTTLALELSDIASDQLTETI